MDASISRASIIRKNDPHDWNSYDHYQTIHEKRLAEHPFVDATKPNTINFRFVEVDGVLFGYQEGQVYCARNVILEVEKLFETRYRGHILQVRAILYRYVVWIRNGHNVLRYHNQHENHDEYHHRVFDPSTGMELFYEVLTRNQFPVFTEVLDEAELLTRYLDTSV